MSANLTKAQYELLDLISDPCFRSSGLSVYGPREFRTARSLARKGLADLTVDDVLTITAAGRVAHAKGAPQ